MTRRLSWAAPGIFGIEKGLIVAIKQPPVIEPPEKTAREVVDPVTRDVRDWLAGERIEVLATIDIAHRPALNVMEGQFIRYCPAGPLTLHVKFLPMDLCADSARQTADATLDQRGRLHRP